jgi:uncharacterized membrane protein
MCAIAYTILVHASLSKHGHQSVVGLAIGNDRKGRLSLALYATAIIGSLVSPWIANSLYVIVALIWLVPDQRIERALAASGSREIA